MIAFAWHVGVCHSMCMCSACGWAVVWWRAQYGHTLCVAVCGAPVGWCEARPSPRIELDQATVSCRGRVVAQLGVLGKAAQQPKSPASLAVHISPSSVVVRPTRATDTGTAHQPQLTTTIGIIMACMHTSVFQASPLLTSLGSDAFFIMNLGFG